MGIQINKKINLLLVAGVIALMGYLFYNDIYNKPKELKENGILISALTTRWKQSTKMGLGLEYEFYYEGKRITAYASSKDLKGNLSFENKYFPVLYDPIHGHKQLLMEPRIFKEYNIPFPDSLKWVWEFLPKQSK